MFITKVSDVKTAFNQVKNHTTKGSAWVLEMVELLASQNEIRFRAYKDGKHRVSTCNAATDKVIHTCVPVKTFYDLLKTYDKDSEIVCTLNERTQVLTIENDRSITYLKCIDGLEYPK